MHIKRIVRRGYASRVRSQKSDVLSMLRVQKDIPVYHALLYLLPPLPAPSTLPRVTQLVGFGDALSLQPPALGFKPGLWKFDNAHRTNAAHASLTANSTAMICLRHTHYLHDHDRLGHSRQTEHLNGTPTPGLSSMYLQPPPIEGPSTLTSSRFYSSTEHNPMSAGSAENRHARVLTPCQVPHKAHARPHCQRYRAARMA